MHMFKYIISSIKIASLVFVLFFEGLFKSLNDTRVLDSLLLRLPFHSVCHVLQHIHLF